MSCYISLSFVFFFKQKTAYEMRISDWSSDVCSSDLQAVLAVVSQNKVRGTGNITNFQLFGTLTLFDDLIGYLTVQTQPSTGTEDPPVWWNMGSRPSKFFDAGEKDRKSTRLNSSH